MHEGLRRLPARLVRRWRILTDAKLREAARLVLNIHLKARPRQVMHHPLQARKTTTSVGHRERQMVETGDAHRSTLEHRQRGALQLFKSWLLAELPGERRSALPSMT
jgi:hypothetical protein